MKLRTILLEPTEFVISVHIQSSSKCSIKLIIKEFTFLDKCFISYIINYCVTNIVKWFQSNFPSYTINQFLFCQLSMSNVYFIIINFLFMINSRNNLILEISFYNDFLFLDDFIKVEILGFKNMLFEFQNMFITHGC